MRYGTSVPVDGGMTEVEIRRAGPEDIDLVMSLRAALERHLAIAPIFVPLIVRRGRVFYDNGSRIPPMLSGWHIMTGIRSHSWSSHHQVGSV